MTIFQAFVLGLVQGLTEFLPISSSAHLTLIPWLFGWQDPGLAFNVALHWGTLAAVLVYFRHEVRLLAIGFWQSLFPSTRDLKNNLHQRMAWLLVLASVPGAIIGKLFEEQAENALRSPMLIAITLSGFGLILWIADQLGHKQKKFDGLCWWEALLIGCSQALAIIPGVSRSGSTIAAGLGFGFQREDAARFSFLMSIPIIFGAGLVKIKCLCGGVNVVELLVGFMASAICGFLSIKYLLRYVAKHDFKIFVCYRIILALFILIVFLYRN